MDDNKRAQAFNIITLSSRYSLQLSCFGALLRLHSNKSPMTLYAMRYVICFVHMTKPNHFHIICESLKEVSNTLIPLMMHTLFHTYTYSPSHLNTFSHAYLPHNTRQHIEQTEINVAFTSQTKV